MSHTDENMLKFGTSRHIATATSMMYNSVFIYQTLPYIITGFITLEDAE